VSRVRDLVETVARTLVDQPSQIEVTEAERSDGYHIELRTADGDLGKMIGRQGRTATAVRTLATLTAEIDGRRATVDFLDERD
jgi:predicted RNA-binding protein YlqC (UPF0109 family)